MGSTRSSVEHGKRVKAMASSNESQCEDVISRVIERVSASGYDETVCDELREHFTKLPSRYTLNIDIQRHEDVLLHMKLLHEAWERQECHNCLSAKPFPLPVVSVRRVQLGNGASSDTDSIHSDGNWGWKSIPRGLVNCSPARIHPSMPDSTSDNFGPSSSIPRPMFGSYSNLADMDDHISSSDYGYELTFACTDRHGLLKYFTSVLSNSALELNIREAHVFSTTDGLALEVFVVAGWPGEEAEELREAVLEGLSNKISDRCQLRAIVEAIAYEDWAVDYKHLVIGERLGGGSSGRLYRGKYLSQDVAIKIIQLEDPNGSSDSGSGSLPAAELLHVFKQEVSIMRLVRHKNLVQFIGACADWPKLCIVTELMAGGSVRDLLESRGCGLDATATVKVLRDAARGMDFLHRRGIVHRDLKAANLLIDEHGVVKVCDFGVARLKPSPVNASGSGNWPAEMTAETGTYRWMSPEVLEHKPYDHRADVYSFGIMIWEILTGEVPYAVLTPLQAAIGVVQRGLRPVMPSTVPEKLSVLAERCWNQDPQQRPEFSEVLVVLEDMMKPANTWRTGFFRKKKQTLQ